jgi:ribonuclease P protein subunit POP4
VLVSVSNLMYHNLVGRRARIISSTDPTQIGLEGNVVDETAHTLTISSRLGKRVVPKSISTFAFYLPEVAVVAGSDIALSQEDRLKKLQRRRK